jgi:hypothetical protein
MTSMRSALLVGLLAFLAVGVGAAVAGPRDVVADYWTDGVLNGSYSLSELRGSLDLPDVQGGSYDAFRDIVSSEIARLVAGGSDETPGSSDRSAPLDKGATPSDSGTGGVNAPNETPGATPPDAPLGPAPTPPASVAQDEDLPVAFIALASLAGLLVLVGGGTAVMRRLRRR